MILRFATMPSMGDLDPNAILWPSRDELDAETDKLLAAIAQLGQDYFNSEGNAVTQTQLTAWNAFVSSVQSWDAGPRFLAHIVDSTWRDDLLAYENQFNSFLGQFAAAGVATTTPAFTFTPAPPSTLDKIVDKATDAAKKAAKPLTDALSTLETVGIVAGVAVLGLAAYLTFETGRTARAIGTEYVRRGS